MPKSPWPNAVAALVSGVLFSIGCALTDPATNDPGIDPSVPDLDASTGARPAPGTTSTPPSSPSDAGTIAPTRTPDAGYDAGPTAAPSVPPKPTQGEVLISEVMYDPMGPEPSSEWFEVYNRTNEQRRLSGLTIVDGGGRSHTIAPGVVIDAGSYAVFVRNQTQAIATKVPSSAILYEYGAGLADTAGILLLNGSTGKVTLVDGQSVIAQAPYGGWFTTTGGQSVQLKVLDYATSDQKASWCQSTTPWTTGSDKGTPGAPCNCP